MLRLLSVAVAMMLLAVPTAAEERVADWIGIQSEDSAAPGTVVYHKSFTLDLDVQEAYLKFTCYTPADFGGTHYKAFVNNIEGAGGSYWQDVEIMNVSKVLRHGDNEIDIEVRWVPMGAPGPILAKVVATGKDKDGKSKTVTIRSDDTWEYSPDKFSMQAKTRPNLALKKVVVAGAADQWEQAKDPRMLPKLDASKVVGVTNVRIKGGNAGSMSHFELVRDYSDKFYFLKALGYWSIEDCVYAQSNYQYPGEWFWGYDKQIAHNYDAAGFAFTVCPWVWVPPDWYKSREKPAMSKCVEHNQDGSALSLWSPLLTKFNEDIYTELKQTFGDSIKFVCPGIYGEFGEANYTAGGNKAHAGFWAGDDLAHADFRAKMLAKYGTLDAINTAWKTSFTSEAELAYPALDGSDPRRYALDFVNWYCDSMTDFTARVCAIAKAHFPDVPIAPKLGCGDENPMSGQDDSAIPKALAKIGVGVRASHGSGTDFAVRRLSSACKFYGTRFEAEAALGGNPQDAAKQFFIDATCGAGEVFAYPDAMLRAADAFSDCRRNTRGEHSITDVAIFFPTSWHRTNLRQGNPPRLVEAAEELRDLSDFDILDEGMILDGALEKYHVLAMFDGSWTEQAVFDKIMKWVDNGGTLLLRSEQTPFTNVDGAALDLFSIIEETGSGYTIADRGRGRVAVWDGPWDSRQDYYNLIARMAATSLTGALGERPDGKRDGVWTGLFKDRVLYLNTTDAPVQRKESISGEFARKAGLDSQPSYLNYTITIPAHGQAAHLLNKPFVEFGIECEQMDGAQKLPTEVIQKPGYGTPGRAVKLGAGGSVRATFQMDQSSDYGFYCVANPTGSAVLEIDGRPVGDITGPAGCHKYMYPMTAKLRLSVGKHTLALNCRDGEVIADKIMLTTDTGLAGFAYGFSAPDGDQTW